MQQDQVGEVVGVHHQCLAQVGEVVGVHHQCLAQVEEVVGVDQHLAQVGEVVGVHQHLAQVGEGVKVFGPPQEEVGEGVYKNPQYNLHGNQVEGVGVENYHHRGHHQKNLSG